VWRCRSEESNQDILDILSVKQNAKLSASKVKEEGSGDPDLLYSSLLTVCHR